MTQKTLIKLAENASEFLAERWDELDHDSRATMADHVVNAQVYIVDGNLAMAQHELTLAGVFQNA